MLYSDNAPELESALHAEFENRRVNLVNPRKEFYRDLELDEIEHFVSQRGLSAQFMRTPEAKEYRETAAKLELLKKSAKEHQRSSASGCAVRYNFSIVILERRSRCPQLVTEHRSEAL
jgi:hypothetical protein